MLVLFEDGVPPGTWRSAQCCGRGANGSRRHVAAAHSSRRMVFGPDSGNTVSELLCISLASVCRTVRELLPQRPSSKPGSWGHSESLAIP